MKRSFQKFKPGRIVLTVFYLLCLSHFGICQTGTDNPARSKAFSESFNLDSHLPEIVRDLKLCDQVRIERDILTEYNASLKNQAAAETVKRIAAEADRDRYKLKTKGRNRIIAALIIAAVVREGLQILIRQ
jgi:hypothetical protein